MKRHPELLMPAGSLPVLKTAVLYGADAVYIGGETFSLRAKARNFSPTEMEEGISFAHEYGVRVYVTANIFAHEADLPEARKYFYEMKSMRPDALLVADPGMFRLAREICPEIPLHISTQANTTNAESCRFWHDLGATRIVTARELSLAELKQLKAEIPSDLEIECFVHGAMCISYSGRCLLSNYFTGRDANRGACTHPCRWTYAVMEETRPGEFMPIEENERGTYVFNSRDLCMIDHIPDLYDAGIDSFKVEGRMKTALYIATAARTYSMAMKDYEEDPEIYRSHLDLYREQIAEGTYRRFTTGFFYGRPGAEAMVYDSNTYLRTYTFLGLAEGMDARGFCLLHQKNKFSVGETIEIMKPDGRNIPVTVRAIYNETGDSQPSAPHPGQELHVDLGGEEVCPYDVLRRKEEEGN